jgi:hypothetical protein
LTFSEHHYNPLKENTRHFDLLCKSVTARHGLKMWVYIQNYERQSNGESKTRDEARNLGYF